MHKLQKEDIDRIVSNLIGQSDNISHIGEISVILRLFNDNPSIDKQKLALANEALAEFMNNTLRASITPQEMKASPKPISEESFGRLYNQYSKIPLIQSIKSNITIEYQMKSGKWVDIRDFHQINFASNWVSFDYESKHLIQFNRQDSSTEHQTITASYFFYCLTCDNWSKFTHLGNVGSQLRFPIKCESCNTLLVRVSTKPSLETIIESVSQKETDS